MIRRNGSAAVLLESTWDCRAGDHSEVIVFPFGADAIDGFLSDQGSLSLHSCDRPPSSARFLLCKQPTKTQPGTVVIPTASPVYRIALHCISFFRHMYSSFFDPLQQRTSRGLWRLVQKWRHMNDLLFFVFFSPSLSPLLRRDNSMLLLLLLLPHRWMIGCDDIYTTGRLFSFWHYS